MGCTEGVTGEASVPEDPKVWNGATSGALRCDPRGPWDPWENSLKGWDGIRRISDQILGPPSKQVGQPHVCSPGARQQ